MNSHHRFESQSDINPCRAFTMSAVARTAIWVEQRLDSTAGQRLVNLEELLEGKLPTTVELPRLTGNLHSSFALERLIALFELSETEVLVLLICLAAELIPNFDHLCADYHGSVEKSSPSFALIIALFSSQEVLDGTFDLNTMKIDSSIREWKLIEVKDFPNLPINRRPIHVDSSILYYLLGSNYQDYLIKDLINYIPHKQFLSLKSLSTGNEIERLVKLYRRANRERYYTIFQLTGTDLTNKENTVSAVARELGYSIIELSYFALPLSQPQLNRLALRLKRWLKIDDSLLLIKADELRDDDHTRNQALCELVNSLQLSVFLSSSEPRSFGVLKTINTEVTTPGENDQLGWWREHLALQLTPKLEPKLPLLVSQFNLTAAAIATIASGVHLEVTNEGSIFDSLWQSCRIAARQKLDGLATRVSSKASWNNLILPDSTKKHLADIISQVNQRAKVYHQWGMGSHRGSGITALFSGTSGTGKTTAAEVIANELKLDLYKIELSTVISKYIGETEKNLRKIFDAAEAGGAILLFDEADALFGKRTEVKDSKDRHSNAEISYLLQKMEAYRGLAILTTNIEEAIDSAFKRRLGFVIKFDFPGKIAREQIWRSVFPGSAPTENLNYEILAKMQLSGGNIRSIALKAAFTAAACNEPIQMKHIVSAAKAEAYKLGSDTYELETMVARLGMNHHDTEINEVQPRSVLESRGTVHNHDSSIEKPNNAPIRARLSNRSQPNGHSWSPQDTYKWAQKFFQDGDYQKGYSILCEGVTIYPHHSGLNFWMGSVVWELKLNVPASETLAALDRAENGDGQWLDNDEGVALCWFIKAQILERSKLADAETCFKLYEKYLEAQPNGRHRETAQFRRNELHFEARFGKRPPD